MNLRRSRLVLVVLTFLSLVVPPPPAAAPSVPSAHGAAGYSMEILVDGAPLPRYTSRGRISVEAIPGREYSIRLRNDSDRRAAFALSVDGLNTIDAQATTARAASKWILDPHQEITIDGWQTSASTARRFFFTTEENSYGAWLGKTDNLGAIMATVFREKRTRPAPVSQGESRDERKRNAEPSMQGSALSGDASAPSRERAATGIGEEVGHEVTRVRFDAESAPAAVLEVRYEYRDNRPCDDGGFAPDPYR